MDKYEWMLNSRPARPATPDQPSSLSLLEELRLSSAPAPPASLRAAPLRDSGPASLMVLTAASDGDASSSGFSDGSESSRAVSRATQTPDTLSPPPAAPSQTAGTPQRKVTAVFRHTPQYKQLFQEIFQVLNKPVATSAQSSATEPAAASVPATSAASASASPPATVPPAVSDLPELMLSEEQPVSEERVTATQLMTVTETKPDTPLAASLPDTELPSEEILLQDTAPSETLSEAMSALSHSYDSSEAPSRAARSRSRSASVTRTFSYAEEYERRLRASTPSAADGAGGAPTGVASSAGCGEEFPLLVRPSEEVAKLRILERSYAEALKAGRRCFYRPTLL